MLTARYTKPIQVVETPAMVSRIKAIADAEGVSFASVLRDLNRAGIEWRERLSAQRVAGDT